MSGAMRRGGREPPPEDHEAGDRSRPAKMWAWFALLLVLLLLAANFLLLPAPILRLPWTPAGPPPQSAPAAPVPPPVPSVAAPPVTPAASAAKGATLVGRVLTAEEANPVPGARVRVEGTSAEAATGPDGAFRLEGLPAGRRTVQVLPADLVPAEVEVVLAEGRETARDVYVLPGAVVEGRVLFDGKPVAGAEVTLVEGARRASSGGDGDFLIRGLGPGDHELAVRAPGFRNQEETIEVPPGVARVSVEVTLRRTWRIRGTVQAEGAPVPGVRVSASEDELFTENAACTTTAPDGSFEVEGTGAAWVRRIYAWKRGVGLGVSGPISIEEGGILEGLGIPFLLDGPVSGVVRLPTGAPGAGVAVAARPMNLAPVIEVVLRGAAELNAKSEADGAGRFSFRLPPGHWNLEATSPGLPPARTGIFVPAGGEAPEVTLQFREGREIRGRVLDREGLPIPGARLRLTGESSFPPVEGVAGADGAFVFPLLTDRTEYDLRAEAGGFVPDTKDIRTGGDPVEFRLQRGSRVSGTVLLADGRTPARAFTLRFYYESTEEGAAWEGGNWPFHEEEVNDPEGRFAIADVESGTISVEAACGDFVTRVPGVRTSPGKDPAPVRLVLRRGGVLRGAVWDAKGNPLRGIDVRLLAPVPGSDPADLDATDFLRWTTVDTAGRYEFRVLAEGRYVVSAEGGPGFFDAARAVELHGGADASADLVLDRGGALRLACVDAAGAPVGEPSLGFIDDEGKGRQVSCIDSEGILGTQDLSADLIAMGVRLPTGTYRAIVSAEGWGDAEVVFTIREDEIAAVRVAMKRE